jgi:hypothetical protein
MRSRRGSPPADAWGAESRDPGTWFPPMQWSADGSSVTCAMRMPIRSETEANRFVFASAAVIAVSVLLGFLTTPLVGVVLFFLALVVGAITYLRADNPDQRTPLRDAEHDPHPGIARSGTRHLLVVANETLAGDELRDRINASDGRQVEIDILAPVLTSHLHYVMSDVDGELADAQARLDRSLAWAKDRGIPAHGEVGDPNATTALEDQLRDFGADEVIVVTHPRERETWQERDELDRLRRELDIPVTQVIVGDREPRRIPKA